MLTKLKTRVLVVILMLSMSSYAQTFTSKENWDKRSVKRFEAAISGINRHAYDEALAELERILEKYPNAIDALLAQAEIYAAQQKYSKSESSYEKALSLSTDYYRPAIYKVGLIEYQQEKYAEAKAHFEEYISTAAVKDRRLEKVRKYLSQAIFADSLTTHPLPFEPQSMGDKINSDLKEYQPSFTADQSLLVYTVNYNGQEDFYYSRRDDQGEWEQGEPLTEVNTLFDEGAQTISADGRLMFFTGCGRRSNMGTCDLYYVEQENGKWGKVVHATMNSRGRDVQPVLSPNADELYFVSNRAGGLGGNDIWRCARLTDGAWSEPENLGAPINTPQDDEAPFLHADAQTLYFMSKGHKGLGGYDLFIARRGADGGWEQPQNMGYPLNTPANEGALVVSLDGQVAYYTTDENTNEGGALNLDIYSFSLHPSVQPRAVTYVHAQVLDITTGKALAGAPVTLVSERDNEKIVRYTDEKGQFLLVLPAGQNYQLEVKHEGYLFYSDRFELTEMSSFDSPFELTASLQPMSSDGQPRPVILRNVLFESGAATLLPLSYDELNRLVSVLQGHMELDICINGHTDDIGNADTNQLLSEKRAIAVYDYLIQQGIQAQRLRYQGYGETRPLVDNDSDENRARNRRTTFTLE